MRFFKFKRDPDSSLDLLWRILAESVPMYWPRYGLAFFFLALASAATAGSAWIMRDVINKIFIDKNLTMLWLIAGMVMGIFAIKGFATYAQAVILSRVGNRIVARNQQRVFDHLLSLDINFFTKGESSQLIMRISRGASAARQAIDLVVVSIGRDLLTLVGLTLVMVIQAPLLSLIALAIAPVAIFGVTKLSRRIREFARGEMLSMAQIIAVIQETAHGARLVKAFGLDDYMRGRMAAAVAGVETRANRMAVLQARSSPLMETLGGFAVAGVILVAGWQTIAYDATPGELMSFLTAMLLAYEPAKRLARFRITLEQAMIGVRMMFDLLDTLPGPTEITQAPELDVRKGRIEFRKVRFAYRPKRVVFRNLNITVEGGSKIALVGPSGGGKSTMFALIQRFFDVKNGAILVDGQDIRGVATPSLRAAIAYVSQDTYMFSGTVRQNIRLGRLDATDKDIEHVAREAHAHDFIEELAQGYDTTVGENGIQLSGGQRQRIAIARAMLKDAPIVLLDEATSALDSETEHKIQQGLDRLTKGKTCLVIAHRLGTVLNADRIMVVKDGNVVEQGTHDELLAKGGFYEKICELQFGQKSVNEAASG